MKLNHQSLETRWMQALLGSVFLAGLGCGAAEPEAIMASDTSSGSIAELSQSLRGRGPGIGSRRHHRGGRGHHHTPTTPPPTPPPVASCGASDSDELLQTINSDLTTLDNDDLPFTRYFNLGDRAQELGCGSALDGERAALSKLINSLSLDPSLEQPIAIDADQTVYRIDLRDFQWDRSIRVGNVAFDDAWEALIASSPYALEFTGDDADDAKEDTGTAVPVVFGSAFVAAAARAPLYYSLLDIPADADDFLRDELGIDVNDTESIRAGFSAATRAGERDLLAERFDIQIRAGYVWQIADFGADLFDDPLGNASGERELAFTLPNGLLGHVLADGNGRVKATADVLLDSLESDNRARIATSFLRQRAQGVDVTDEIRAFVLANPGNFNPAERAAILAAYPAAVDLQQILDSDRDGFVARALQQLNLDIETTPEPISQSFTDFSAPVDAATAAAELFVTTGDLLANLDLVDPALAPLATGTVSRDVFTANYRSSLCILSTVLENPVDSALCL
ncbi:MAG: hypothetical protein RL033_6541 [Pseudomonadota bacterium]